jgi:hypothetical protein
MEAAGLMTRTQYRSAEHYLIGWMQLINERETGHVIVVVPKPVSDDDDNNHFDDPCVKTHSTERDRALDEYQIFCNVCKMQRNRPQSYTGETISLGRGKMPVPIAMGKVATRGENITASPPFVACNLADFINNEGRFDLVAFFHLQKHSFPTLYKLAVCISSVRTNEVGCERFFSMAGYVSCP